MERQSFIFYIEWRDALAGCSEEVRLEVYDAIVEYAASRILPKDISPIARIAFMFIKNDIDNGLTLCKECHKKIHKRKT